MSAIPTRQCRRPTANCEGMSVYLVGDNKYGSSSIHRVVPIDLHLFRDRYVSYIP